MSTEIKLIVVATINSDEMESFNTYIEGLTKCYDQVGAKTVVQYPITQTYLGNLNPDFVSVISFENEGAFDKVYKSSSYQSLLGARSKAFKSIEVYISKP